MPQPQGSHKDVRTKSIADKGKTDSGLRNVTYRDLKGQTWNAIVLGGGTASGIKIRLTSQDNRVIDNVAKATTPAQTNVYFATRIEP